MWSYDAGNDSQHSMRSEWKCRFLKVGIESEISLQKKRKLYPVHNVLISLADKPHGAWWDLLELLVSLRASMKRRRRWLSRSERMRSDPWALTSRLSLTYFIVHRFVFFTCTVGLVQRRVKMENVSDVRAFDLNWSEPIRRWNYKICCCEIKEMYRFLRVVACSSKELAFYQVHS